MNNYLRCLILSSLFLLTACTSVARSDNDISQCQALRHEIRQERFNLGPYPKDFHNGQLLNQMELEYREQNCQNIQLHAHDQ